MFKKISTWLALASLSLVLVSCGPQPSSDNQTSNGTTTAAPAPTTTTNTTTSTTTPTEVTMKQPIDVYIIAGQSNASGYTLYDKTLLQDLWSDYQTGSPRVLYMGRAEYTNHVNTPLVSTGVNEFKAWTPARAGMGFSAAHMGAEVGMASYLSTHYYTDANSGNTAGIIKFAHGGTSLLNNLNGENAAGGNWVSPSYAKALGVSYDGLTGGLYRGLLRQIETGVASLQALGYDDINVKGVFWMQGESDVWNPAEYGRAFTFFVDDLRADIGKITGKSASSLPIMVGEISRTSGSASAASVTQNEAFIEKQRALSTQREAIYVIPSAQFEINWLEVKWEGQNGVNKNDGDPWHWNTTHMFTIGELVGRCIVENILQAE